MYLNRSMFRVLCVLAAAGVVLIAACEDNVSVEPVDPEITIVADSALRMDSLAMDIRNLYLVQGSKSA